MDFLQAAISTAMGGLAFALQEANPVKFACADACAKAFCADPANPIEAKVFAKGYEQFKDVVCYVVTNLKHSNQCDDEIAYLEETMDKTAEGELLEKGLTFELKNGSAVHVLFEKKQDGV
jgi:hypothetical protein